MTQFGNRGGMTIKITIERDGLKDVWLTGNSYKYWWEQAVELIYRTYGDRDHGWRFSDIEDLDIEVEMSRSKWIGWGGLKWCREDIIQKELNREGVQDDEPDNPKPRQYAEFKFDYYPAGYRKLMKELR